MGDDRDVDEADRRLDRGEQLPERGKLLRALEIVVEEGPELLSKVL